jgi:hypothetical protein
LPRFSLKDFQPLFTQPLSPQIAATAAIGTNAIVLRECDTRTSRLKSAKIVAAV